MLFHRLFSLSAIAGLLGSANAYYDEPLRPQIHWSPPKGFMNDPNGMIYTNGLYHMYFQLDPNSHVAGVPKWGHATSKDLNHWEYHGIAINSTTPEEGVFSGSAVLDPDNTSGFFDDSVKKSDRIVAIFTSNTPGLQTQDIAYSTDGGYTFTRYEKNPVININDANFRDPKVRWHNDIKKWVMVVAKPWQYKIAFYTSPNLKEWTEVSDFTGGWFGFQYECPDLFKIPVAGTDEYKWVLLISVNPGAPLGGSATQYFVGDFDGTKFTADNDGTRVLDLGPDWYASQTWANTADGSIIGIGWSSNWDYTNLVPTYPWRGTMSIARRMQLKPVKTNPEYSSLALVQDPIIHPSIKGKRTCGHAPLSAHTNSGAFEFRFNLSTNPDVNATVDNPAARVEISNAENQKTVLGFATGGSGINFWIDRSGEFEFPLFSEKIHNYANAVDDKHPVFDIHGVVDRGIVELFINDGAVAFTNTVFVKGANKLLIETDAPLQAEGDIYELKSTWR